MATLCLAFGISPADYRSLTIAEHRALCDALKKANKG